MFDPVSAYYCFKYGYKGANAVMDWLNAQPKAETGSVEDIRQLREITEALCQDNQRLINLTQHQKIQIEVLQKWVTTAFIIMTILAVTIIWILLNH